MSELIDDILVDLALERADADVDAVLAVVAGSDGVRALAEAQRIGAGAPILALVPMGAACSTSAAIEGGAAGAIRLEGRLVQLKSELVALVTKRRGAAHAMFVLGSNARAFLGLLRRRRDKTGGRPLSEDADQLFERAIRLDRYLDACSLRAEHPTVDTFRIGLHARVEALMQNLSGFEMNQLERAIEKDVAEAKALRHRDVG